MSKGPNHTDRTARERERLAALDRLRILDTPPEEAFDRITRLAARLLGTPISLISLVDERRQWFKSHHGLDVGWTGREIAFCDHAIRDAEPLVVPDALNDVRFNHNPLVVSDPCIRFYAGAPLRLASGHVMGTLCVIDRRPHSDFGEEHARVLADLADMVVERLEARRLMEALRDEAAARERTEEALRGSLAEREALLREIHHRVKNNLQAIASIVQVEAVRLGRDSIARSVLDAIGDRISVMFGIHQKLYTTEELDRIEMGEQIEQLALRLQRLHGREATVRLDVRCALVWLDSDTALRVGLIANELISNSLRHAYPPDGGGTIRVELSAGRGVGTVLTVRDDGRPKAPAAAEGVGLMLVRALAQQIGARFDAGPVEPGWEAQLVLPADR